MKVILGLLLCSLTYMQALKIRLRYKQKFSHIVVERYLERLGYNLDEVETDTIDLEMEIFCSILPDKGELLIYLPIVNILYSYFKGLYYTKSKKAIEKVLTSNDSEILTIIEAYYVDECEEEDDFAIDNGVDYFIRFGQDGNYSNIWFSFVDNELVINNVSGPAKFMSLEDQKRATLTVLKDLSQGIDNDYGYKDLVLELTGNYEFFQPEEVENQEDVVIRRVRKK